MRESWVCVKQNCVSITSRALISGVGKLNFTNSLRNLEMAGLLWIILYHLNAIRFEQI
jgi:hypothetical protein